MSAPTILSATPVDQATDVILGSDIVLTFDQPIDPITVSEDTFLLQGPGSTNVTGPEQFIELNPTPLTGREYLLGTFNWNSDNTVLTFDPVNPLQPNFTYTVMIVGAGLGITSDTVKNLAGESLDKTYRWTFQTGILNLTVPPIASPLPPLEAVINPSDIIVRITPKLRPVGNDLTQEVDFIFPGPINPSTFNPADFQASIDPILNDIYVIVPDGLTYQVVLSTDTKSVKVSVSGWPVGY